jgi:HSP20 family molecular chaperone IbpA
MGKEKAMDTLAKSTISRGLMMGRPRDDDIAEDDERDIKCRIAPDDFKNREKGPSIHILEDWLKHEADLLRPIHIILSESSDALSIRADVPGVKEEDLKIKLEPARVMITRRPAMSSRFGAKHSASCSHEMTRVINLPAAVTVNKIRIAVRDGVLELDLAKAEPAKRKGTETNARSDRI